MTAILGLNAYHADSAACLVVDGEIVGAVEEERFLRLKHWAGFPKEAIDWCLAESGLTLDDVDVVAVNQNVRANLGARIGYAIKRRPSPQLVLERLRNQRKRRSLGDELGGVEITYVEHHLALGPAYGDDEIRAMLDATGCSYESVGDVGELCARTAEAVADGQVVGWFQGRLEWGPRALGNRSIVCDPRRADMKEILNAKIKRRESFRPFAPSILQERVPDWFEHDEPVPYMSKVFQIREERRREVPAVTHVDGSGRLQTVDRSANPRYYGLIEEFEKRTGVPMVLNTSFNENEPIVCRPEEALGCFLRTEMDLLVLGDHLVRR